MSDIQDRTVLVTGGAGFIGSNFIRHMLDQKRVNVVNIDLLTYAGNRASLQKLEDTRRYVFRQGDICDAGLMADVLAVHEPVAVFHFAAESHVDRSIDAPDAFIRTNVLGTANLLKQCLDYWQQRSSSALETFRFLHVSTDEVYGSLGQEGRFTEHSPYQPNSPYAASKASADHLVRAYHQTFGLPTMISNCSNNYGPYQYPEKLVPLMTLNAIEGKRLPVYGDGRNVRDWLFVTDHCEALRLLWLRGTPGEVYNIGGDAERSNIEVVQTICRIVDELCPDLPHRPCTSLIQYVTDRPGHDRRYAIDAAKIQSTIGWTPSVGFEEGIRQTVQWYLQNPAWVESVASAGQRPRIGLRQPQRATKLQATTRPAKNYTDGTIADVQVRKLMTFSDDRGWLIELFRSDEVDALHMPVMAYVSQTQPGVTRGPHEHVEQADFFAFVGPGDFELTMWDSRPTSATYGRRMRLICGESRPAAVILPPGIVHAYKNVSSYSGWVFNAPNRLYAGQGKQGPVDEIRHEDRSDSPYAIDDNAAIAIKD